MTKQKMINTLNEIMACCTKTNLDVAPKLEDLTRIVKKLVQQLPEDFDA